jgi:predicted MPP superfamily phosphohydrolase
LRRREGGRPGRERLSIPSIRYLGSEERRLSARRRWRAFRERLERRGLKRSERGLKHRTRSFERMVGILSLGVRGLGLWRRGLRNASALRLVRHQISLPGLPAAFDGYRILHLSDLHIDLVPHIVEATRNIIGGLEVDLAVLTGDYHARYGQEGAELVEPYAAIFRALRSKDGIVGILGNHDSASIADAMASLGATVLVNESIAVRRGGSEVYLTGTDDVHHYWSPAARRTLAETPQDRLRVALVHTSELAEEASRLGYALYLTGHTHGGQICLPGGFPVITMGVPRAYSAGLWRIGRMVGHTSRGIGASTIPLRFNCPPEIALLTLTRSASDRAGGPPGE